MIDSFSEEWVVLGKHNCPWCLKVRVALDFENIPFRYYDLDHNPELKEWAKAQGYKTVPQVFHLGVNIGGYEATVRYLEAPRDEATIGN